MNVDPAFDLQYADYGSNLEYHEDKVRRGKENSKYVIVKGIHLYPGEVGEDIELAVTAPKEAGTYSIWITASCDQCDHGTFKYPISVIAYSGVTSETQQSTAPDGIDAALPPVD